MKSRNICKVIPSSVSEKLEITRFIYETDQNIIKNEQKLAQNRIILFKQGSARLKIDNMEYNVETGHVIFAFEDERISIVSKEYCEYLYIDFGGIRAQMLFRRFYIDRSSRIFDGFDGLIPMWHDSLCRASKDTIDLAAESVLLYTFSRLGVNSSGNNNLIVKILEITEEHFTDPELTVVAMAKELSYSAKYLSHVFKEKMGVSYSEYLRTLRIKYAVSLFEHGIDSVKNVAFLSGFTDQLYFSTVFKKVIGVPPKEYKKHILKEVEL